ncbi:hypothetical protein GT034_03990 [Streptomyces sp. SID2563]|nr:hypothetical protein [Streptomyces sp. SID2563]
MTTRRDHQGPGFAGAPARISYRLLAAGTGTSPRPTGPGSPSAALVQARVRLGALTETLRGRLRRTAATT